MFHHDRQCGQQVARTPLGTGSQLVVRGCRAGEGRKMPQGTLGARGTQGVCNEHRAEHVVGKLDRCFLVPRLLSEVVWPTSISKAVLFPPEILKICLNVIGVPWEQDQDGHESDISCWLALGMVEISAGGPHCPQGRGPDPWLPFLWAWLLLSADIRA